MVTTNSVPTSDAEFGRLLETEPTVLILRMCGEDRTSHDGYQWPAVGEIARPKRWSSQPWCGDGLHGWMWGEGEGALGVWDRPSVALVVRALERTIVALGGKVKVPACLVEYEGTLAEAAEYIASHLPPGRVPGAIIGRTVAAGDDGTATAGYRGTATVGARGTATAGLGGTATAGDEGTATAGDYGSATAGDYGSATAGYYGTAIAGDYGAATVGARGTATAGDYGSATAGDHGDATAGDDGTATAGANGTATVGIGGTARAGADGLIVIRRWDRGGYRWHEAAVGDNGIKPDVAYRLDMEGNFREVP